jgi:hypothetical protein
MNILIGGRQRGKTTRLLRMADPIGATIVVVHLADKQRLIVQARDLGLSVPLVLTFDDVRQGRHRGLSIDHLVIDDADRLLQSLFPGARIDTITFDGTIETIGPVTVEGILKAEGSQ